MMNNTLIKVVPDCPKQRVKRLAAAYGAIHTAPNPAVAEIWKATARSLERQIAHDRGTAVTITVKIDA